jgi:hypothetical protein
MRQTLSQGKRSSTLNRGNSYDGEALMVVYASDLRPEETREKWDRFEIRKDERPIELRRYICAGPPVPCNRLMAQVWTLP